MNPRAFLEDQRTAISTSHEDDATLKAWLYFFEWLLADDGPGDVGEFETLLKRLSHDDPGFPRPTTQCELFLKHHARDLLGRWNKLRPVQARAG